MATKTRRKLTELGITTILFVVGTLGAYAFSAVGLHIESAFMLFVLGVIITTMETDSPGWGIGLSLLYLLVYDFLLTDPRFTLKMANPNFYISYIVFIIVAFVLNSLATKLQHQLENAEDNATVLKGINKISTGLINSTSAEDACRYTARELSKAFDTAVEVTLGQPDSDDPEALRCFRAGYPMGAGEGEGTGTTFKYLPLVAKGRTYGVVSVDCQKGDLSDSKRFYLDSVITQTVIAIERNELEQQRRITRMRNDSERFKTNLLENVSRSLLAPLNSIINQVDFLSSYTGDMDSTESASFRQIVNDVNSLSDMIDNLLRMTRLQDIDTELEKEPSSIQDIVHQAVRRREEDKGHHEFALDMPEEPLIAPMNRKLIVQVLVNLIDNVYKHTRIDSTISIATRRQHGNLVVTVADDGGGIDPEKVEAVFRRFYSGDDSQVEQQETIGLGLSICRAIVEAHGGQINARNNTDGGATFTFTIPMR
jgi:two-component system sensor histidine kinase KdpD